MGKKKQISSEKVAQAILLKEEGYKQKDIATRLSISQQAVSLCLKRYTSTGQLVAKSRSGRPVKTTETTDRHIHRLALAHPTMSSTEIASRLPIETIVSSRTIRRRLKHKFKLRAYRQALKPLLSKRVKQQRKQFALKHKKWTKEEWSKVLFSDEAMVRQFYSFRAFVRRPPNMRYCSTYTAPTVKKVGSLMIWGAISANGVGPLHIFEANKTVDAKSYLNLLQKHLKNALKSNKCNIFQHDGAPIHNAKVIKEWLNKPRNINQF